MRKKHCGNRLITAALFLLRSPVGTQVCDLIGDAEALFGRANANRQVTLDDAVER